MSDPWSTSQSPEITGSRFLGLILGSQIFCVIFPRRTPAWRVTDRRQVVYWTRRFTCQTPVFPPTDHSVDLRFCGKHRDTAPGLGLWRWATSCSAGFNRIEKQVQNDPKFITLNEKTWCPVHLKIRLVQGNLSRCFQAKIGWFTKRLTEREDFPLSHHEPFFRLSNPANVAKSLLDGNREHLLDEGRKWNL